MATIPLPALHLNPPPQQESPLDQYARLMQLKSIPLQQQALQQNVQAGQLDIQQKQQALNDQKAITAAMQSWDGKDYNDLYPLMLKGGASGQAILGLKQKVLEQQQSLSTIAKNNGDAAVAQVNAAKTRGDLLDGALTPLIDPKQTPDEKLPGALTAAAQDLAQRGILDPQHAQQASQLSQLPPDQIRSQLDILRKTNLAQSQVMEEAAKNAGIGKDIATTNEANARANEINMQMQTGGTQAMADSRYRNILMKMNQKQPVSPDDVAFKAAYEKQKTLVPVANFNLQNAGATGAAASPTIKGLADGSIKWGDIVSQRTPLAIKEQLAAEVKAINPNWSSGDFSVEQGVRKDFTSGTDSNSLTAINRAREHMGVFMQAAKDIDNGNVQALNKLGNAISTEFGSDKAGNLNIAKQAFSAEVGKAFAGASVAEGDRQELQKSISTASSFQQLAGAARTADSLLAGAQKVLKQKYEQGLQGKPNFGEQNSPQGGGLSVTAPNGKVYTFKSQADADAFKQKAGIQ